MLKKEEFLGYEQHEYNPIIREKSLQLLKRLLQEKQPKNILEIGTFIGYSSAVMLECCPESFVTTLEKDKNNAEFAVKNLSNLGFDGRFKVVNCDAYDFLEQQNGKEIYDFVFLDGPKGQYVKYLPHIKRLMKKGAILVADDVMFYGLVNSKEKIEHKHRALVNNLRKFLFEIQNDADFTTKVYDFEDGVSVSEKIN